jgi:hypothetical protein
MFRSKEKSSELYFLKTGNSLIQFHGYFKNKKKLTKKLHEILEESFKILIREWENKHKRKWFKKEADIISNEDICHSVEMFKYDLERTPTYRRRRRKSICYF